MTNRKRVINCKNTMKKLDM